MTVRSTESYAFCRLMKHRNNGTRAFLPNSCSLWTANIISIRSRTLRAKPVLLLRQQVLLLPVGAESRSDDLEKDLTLVCYE